MTTALKISRIVDRAKSVKPRQCPKVTSLRRHRTPDYGRPSAISYCYDYADGKLSSQGSPIKSKCNSMLIKCRKPGYYRLANTRSSKQCVPGGRFYQQVAAAWSVTRYGRTATIRKTLKRIVSRNRWNGILRGYVDVKKMAAHLKCRGLKIADLGSITWRYRGMRCDRYDHEKCSPYTRKITAHGYHIYDPLTKIAYPFEHTVGGKIFGIIDADRDIIFKRGDARQALIVPQFIANPQYDNAYSSLLVKFPAGVTYTKAEIKAILKRRESEIVPGQQRGSFALLNAGFKKLVQRRQWSKVLAAIKRYHVRALVNDAKDLRQDPQESYAGSYVVWQSTKIPVPNWLIKEIVLMEPPWGGGTDFTQLLVLRSAWKELREIFTMRLTRDNAKAVNQVRKRLSKSIPYYRRWVAVPRDLLQIAKQMQRASAPGK